MLKLFNEYPTFHDAMVCSVSMERAKRVKSATPGVLFDPRKLELVDVLLELKHRVPRSRAERVGQIDYGVTVALLDVQACDIDLNAMLADSFVNEVTLSRETDGLFLFDLEPNIGLSMSVRCAEVQVRAVWPYPAESPFDELLP
ncbi:Imm50 family immunity protein [Burkholderia sp. Bp9090]|uniref:Imm50 family immunity protein n=1 Tax=Burkholderia sp. Bp9090 TaxID=2184567 RepID=UPI001639C6C7|nr:Imm50 family immunity protein [Burkholderia sp. Bp9090]